MPQMPPTFRPQGKRSRVEQKREHDQRRGSARDRLYTWRWDKAAKAYKLAHPLCLGCAAVGRVTATDVVDHIEPHKFDQRLFWDQDNWQPSCRWHHDVVKQRLEAQFANGDVGADDLRLDSTRAKALTLDLDPL